MPSPITITDKTVDPLIVAEGQPVAAYEGVTVADADPLNSTETISITLSQSLTQALGLNYSFYPTVTNLGSISDPGGGGAWDPATETFTESGLVNGDPTFATKLLSRLVYNTPQLPNGQAFAAQASITVTNGISTTTDPTPVIVGDVAPPAITGTVPNEPIALVARSLRSRRLPSPGPALVITIPLLSLVIRITPMFPGRVIPTMSRPWRPSQLRMAAD